MSEFTEKDKQIVLPTQETSQFGAIQHFKRFSAGAGATQFKITESEVSIGNVASGSNYISWDGTSLTISADINSNDVKTAFAQHISGTVDRLSTDVIDNTTAHFGMMELSHGITINRITIRSGAAAITPGTFDIAVYSEDGQTKLIDITTATISATFTYQTITLSPTVHLPAGVYYTGLVGNGTVSASFMGWKSPLDDDTYALTGGKVTSGYMTVSAGTLPATFNPVSDLTFAHNRTVVLRLDNV